MKPWRNGKNKTKKFYQRHLFYTGRPFWSSPWPRTEYDPEADAMYISLVENAEPARQIHIVQDEFIVDVDAAGRPVGVEIVGAAATYGKK